MTISIFEHSIISDFSNLHPEAWLEIGFQQEFRIHQKEQMEQNIPRFGMLPIDYADDNYKNLPIECSIHDIIIPLYQSEALSIHFHSNFMSERKSEYPFAIKVDLEGINAISGQGAISDLCRLPKNYFTTLEQNELSGFIDNNKFNQFIAAPLAYIQSNKNRLQQAMNIYSIFIEVIPLKFERFDKCHPAVNQEDYLARLNRECTFDDPKFSDVSNHDKDINFIEEQNQEEDDDDDDDEVENDINELIDYEKFFISDWERKLSKRYTIHIINTCFWNQYLSNKLTFHEPIKYKDYKHFDIPWHDHYNEAYSYSIGNNI